VSDDKKKCHEYSFINKAEYTSQPVTIENLAHRKQHSKIFTEELYLRLTPVTEDCKDRVFQSSGAYYILPVFY
jgi:hypothetical protein